MGESWVQEGAEEALSGFFWKQDMRRESLRRPQNHTSLFIKAICKSQFRRRELYSTPISKNIYRGPSLP